MGADRFARLTCGVTDPSARRGILRALAAGLAALAGSAGLRLGDDRVAVARRKKGKKGKKDKKSKKPLQRNGFGCVSIGKACHGKDAACCSGICQGTKPKQGKKDTSRCVGHDESTCSPGQNEAFCGGPDNIACTTSIGLAGQCNTTTGEAAYCVGGGDCFPCSRDADCEAACGPRAACMQCAAGCPQTGGTACVGVAQTCTF
jgi:hypothetical protein